MMLGNSSIKVLYPGKAINSVDSGVGSIGRIDHPIFTDNKFIGMHPHSNDEILSYFKSGKANHKDSEGVNKTIGGNILMLMRAGKVVYHEEEILGKQEIFEGLQIFIRPRAKDLETKVIFETFDESNQINKWRLIASPSEETKLQFTSSTWIYDLQLKSGYINELPNLYENNLTFLLYVFKGSILVNENIRLEKMDSVLSKNESLKIKANQNSELVLFVTNEDAELYLDGMYSGNKLTST